MHRATACLVPILAATLAPAQDPQYAVFASGCSGRLPVSRLVLQAPPCIGTTLEVELTNLAANAAFMLTGLSRSDSPYGSLPLDLTPFGMPGCFAHVRGDVPVLVFGLERARYACPIPSAADLVGVRFYQQALVLDPCAGNAAGAVMSDAADARIGLPGLPIAGYPVPELVPVPAGSFWMGSTLFFTEQPVHHVTISRPFWLGRYEVTQAQYQAVMHHNPAYTPGADHPVERLTWASAMAYCAMLTAHEDAAGRLPAGYEYRLPTEAEWEYACRAGTTTEWNVGTSLGCGDANIGGCSGSTRPVGGYAPNAWGLHDMHGNVMEYCLDHWSGGANYPTGPVVDPYVAGSGLYIARGGCFTNDAFDCRSATRRGASSGGSSWAVGFRVALAPVLTGLAGG